MKKQFTFALAKALIGLWCNGNTTDSGPVFSGSSPDSPTYIKLNIDKKNLVRNQEVLFLCLSFEDVIPHFSFVHPQF